MRLAAAVCCGVALVASLGLAAVQKPKVTLIGDSVSDRMERNPDALASLTDGFRLNLQTRGCRTLVLTGCTIAGQTVPPPTALRVVQRFGRYLGSFVVVEVGYNDDPARYRRDLDTVMRTLQRFHVKTVIWLTLRDPVGAFTGMNQLIETAPRRWPQLVIADWNSYSAGHPDWFDEDGIHPTPLGAANLGQFVHNALVRAAAKRTSVTR
ncbi:MAG: hypothetical protein E6G14_15955 [Actinobacteria bacterium]|nr:MAG: hypothetical protein E6G14_15955 [Actinomycetota bacterium]